MKFLYLKCRCGVDGFICLVKSNDEYTLPPKWFFTSPELDHNLSALVDKGDAGIIGRRLEAFSMSLRSSDGVPFVASMDEHGTV